MYKTYPNSDTILEIKGLISQEILVGFVEIIKEQLQKQSSKYSIVKKVFSVMIELVQNIVLHSAESFTCENNYKIGRGIALLKKEKSSYIISTGNMISNKNIFNITDLLESVNSLDENGKKKLYKDRLKKIKKKSSNNAGIGLIDVARKSGNPIAYKIKSIDSKKSFIEISARINRIINEK